MFCLLWKHLEKNREGGGFPAPPLFWVCLCVMQLEVEIVGVYYPLLNLSSQQ